MAVMFAESGWSSKPTFLGFDAIQEQNIRKGLIEPVVSVQIDKCSEPIRDREAVLKKKTIKTFEKKWLNVQIGYASATSLDCETKIAIIPAAPNDLPREKMRTIAIVQKNAIAFPRETDKIRYQSTLENSIETIT